MLAIAPLLPAVMPPAASHLTAIRTHRFDVALPVAEAFTLFEPIGEKRWAEGWHPIFASPDASTLSDGSVFTVDRPGGATIWLVTHYDRAGHAIEYRMVAPGERVSRITVQCRATADRSTAVSVTYHYTGLSESGDRYIAAMTEPAFRAMIGEWDQSIRDYLQRGTPATP